MRNNLLIIAKSLMASIREMILLLMTNVKNDISLHMLRLFSSILLKGGKVQLGEQDFKQNS